MVTIWTLLIVLALAWANAVVCVIGVRRKVANLKHLWHNEAGIYVPWPTRFQGFYRGAYINMGFGGTALAITSMSLAGEPRLLGREAMFVMAILNFSYGPITAFFIPSDFTTQILIRSREFWKVLWFGLLGAVVYFGTGTVMASYCSSLKP